MPEVMRCSTADFQPRECLRAWSDVMGRSLVELEIGTDDDVFRGTFAKVSMGRASFCEMSTGSQVAHRTCSGIARTSTEPTYGLIQVREGVIHFSQRKNEGVLGPGDCVLLDRMEPYSLVTRGTSCSIVGLPAVWLKAWIPEPGDLVAKPLSGSKGWSNVLSAYLRELSVDYICDSSVLSSRLLIDQVAGMLALVGDKPEKMASSRHLGKMYDLALECLRERALDVDASPESVAQALNISKRNLHYLFAKQETTFGAQLMEVRLTKARELLSDRRFNHIAIGELAYRCGFSDQSHFCKRFKSRFGCSPSAFRNNADSGRAHLTNPA